MLEYEHIECGPLAWRFRIGAREKWVGGGGVRKSIFVSPQASSKFESKMALT